jgi:hypothetical protein
MEKDVKGRCQSKIWGTIPTSAKTSASQPFFDRKPPQLVFHIPKNPYLGKCFHTRKQRGGC